MNLENIRDYVRRMLNEDEESQGFYSDMELNVYINEAYKELVNIHPLPTKLYELYAIMKYTTTTGLSTYLLPSDFNKLVSVKYGSYYCSIVNFAIYTALGDNRNFTATAALPLAYKQSTNLVISPSPANDSTIILLAYVKTPLELLEDSDIPEINTILHELIALGALERAKIKDNEFDEGKYHFIRMKKKLYDTYKMLLPEEEVARR